MKTDLIPNTGYIFNFQGKAFSPDGMAGELTQERIDAHNKALAQVELESLIREGRGILYLVLNGEKLFDCCASSWQVTQWAGGWKTKLSYLKTSFHNMAGKDGRTDVWFTGPDGKRWHGVNIGDNQICRVHRLKRQP